MTVRPCWNCRQPATHTLTRDGSIPLDACDNCTRIDREQAERQSWTITPIDTAQQTTHTNPARKENQLNDTAPAARVNADQLELPDASPPDTESIGQPSVTAPTPRPLIDRTNCFTSLQEASYRVGVPTGGSYGQGRTYTAARDGDRWNITRLGAPTMKADPEDVALLRRYLEGPRRARLVIVRKGGGSYYDTIIAERPYVVVGGPDVNDWEAWRAWTATEARKILTEQYTGKVSADDLFYAMTMDTEAGYLQGWRGLWPLDRRGVNVQP